MSTNKVERERAFYSVYIYIPFSFCRSFTTAWKEERLTFPPFFVGSWWTRFACKWSRPARNFTLWTAGASVTPQISGSPHPLRLRKARFSRRTSRPQKGVRLALSGDQTYLLFKSTQVQVSSNLVLFNYFKLFCLQNLFFFFLF